MKVKKGCNRCQYTWEEEQLSCPICGQLFTHVDIVETITKEEFFNRYGFVPVEVKEK